MKLKRPCRQAMREQKLFTNYYKQSVNRPQNSFQLQNLLPKQQKQRRRQKVWQQNVPKTFSSFRKRTTDYVTKSKFFGSIRKRRTGNCAGYVTSRQLSGK